MILADYFDVGGTIDVVPSDVVVGLRTLARVQQQKQSECRVELKRRVSFMASLKKSEVNQDDVKAKVQDYDMEEMGDQDQGSPDRLRLVHFQDEEVEKGVEETDDIIDVKNEWYVDRSNQLKGRGAGRSDHRRRERTGRTRRVHCLTRI